MGLFDGTNAGNDAQEVIKQGLEGMHEYVHREMDRLHQMHQLLIIASSPNVSVGQMKECFHGLRTLSAKDWKQDS